MEFQVVYVTNGLSTLDRNFMYDIWHDSFMLACISGILLQHVHQLTILQSELENICP